eukprot:5234948-Prymnesium_polylepis.1
MEARARHVCAGLRDGTIDVVPERRRVVDHEHALARIEAVHGAQRRDQETVVATIGHVGRDHKQEPPAQRRRLGRASGRVVTGR